MNGTLNVSQQSSCGIKKVVDCKITENGQQMYKVKWEPTWEPAENLVACQHLINEFWSHINKVKSNEEKATQYQKRIKLDDTKLVDDNNMGKNLDMFRLTNDSKASIHRLISQTKSTPVGTTNLILPSASLHSQSIQINGLHDKDRKPENIASDANLKMKKNSIVSPLPSETFSPSGKTLNNSSLKYLENFDNPYVKVVVVCKICNKEQSFKVVSNWKRHYLTHTDDKPHKCPRCDKAFVQSDKLRNHIKSKHSAGTEVPNSMVVNGMIF